MLPPGFIIIEIRELIIQNEKAFKIAKSNDDAIMPDNQKVLTSKLKEKS